LDMGFIHDIRKILALLPAKRQNLLFSATFPEEIRKLAGSFMHSPVTVEVARRNTPAELVGQVAHPVDAGRKRELLTQLLTANYAHPHAAEAYVHRIGRTGRAGAEGEAVSLVSHEDRPLLAAIEKLMNRKVEQRIVAGFEPGSAGAPRPQQEQQRRGQQRPQQ